ncbi:MAG TPA: deoxyribonuclease V [Planctomycetota bacterium]|nr:deoxyribonuclease V [Planctomycetota bacterium]
MKVRRLHRWDVDYHAAVAIQERLRKRIIRRGSPRNVKHVAGADVSYERSDNRFYAAVVVMRFPQLDLVEEAHASGVATFPYIPGLLTFREGPILVRVFERLKTRPDLVIFDGQGIAHPRGFGLAAHMGLLIDVPSVGCAKTRLCGEHSEVAAPVGSTSPLHLGSKTIGVVLRTRRNVKPVFVSVGHRIALESAAAWVLKTTAGYRLPEPTRQAHLLVNQLRLEAKGATSRD